MNELLEKLRKIKEAQVDKGEVKFWTVNKKTNEVKVLINELQNVLSRNGNFWQYKMGKQSTIVHIADGGIIDLATSAEMKGWLQNYVLTTYPEEYADVMEAVKRWDSLFSRGMLEFMPEVHLNLLRHTPTRAYYPFRNGILEIAPDEPFQKRIVPYAEMGMHVWKGHIIDFDFELRDENKAVLQGCDFFKFLQLVNGNDDDRIVYAASIIGYMLHTYKDKNRPFAVILAEETQNENSGGGTGKGIFFTAIGKMINSIVVDGKGFKHDKAFLFQRASIDTQLIVIDDCRKNLDFQGFYSHITEGLTIEKKNKDEIYVPYEDSPKFLFSTNFVINVEGEHGKRRTKILEFSDFFNAKNTPFEYFGHMLFTGWDDAEWNVFYNLMATFVQVYLEQGIVGGQTSNSLKVKSIKQKFSAEFWEYWNDIKGKDDTGWRVLGDAYNTFVNEQDVEERQYSKRKFHFAMESASKEFGYVFETKKNSQNGGKKDFKISKKGGEIEVV